MNSQALKDLNSTLDERDQEILQRKAALFAALLQPTVGDFVDFADGQTRRISHIWSDETFQNSESGSFYLGNGYVSFSGALNSSLPNASLTLTEERRNGWFWFFHHNLTCAGGGRDVQIPCRVWSCCLPSNRY